MNTRVLMFGWEFPPHNSGGLGVACLGLTKALAEKGIDIIFVLPKRAKIESNFLRFVYANIGKIKCREIPTLLVPYITSGQYDKLYLQSANSIYGPTLLDEVKRYAEKAREIAWSEEFDIIHAHDWLSSLAGVEAKITSGKPLILHIHATEFDRAGGDNVNKEVYEIEKRGMQMADKIVAVSNYTKQTIVDRYGIPESKVVTVHNGNTLEKNSVKPQESLMRLKARGYKIVLFLGRFTVQKGPDKFIEAASKVLKYYPKVIFVMVGDGDMQPQMLEQIARLGISNKFLFPGFLRGDDIPEVYKAADLFVMPSVAEPFGLVTLESLINGTPVIISKQSGVSEVLKHALKVDFWDIDEMTNQIISVLHHRPLQKTLAQNGYRDAVSVTWDKAADKVSNIYNNLSN